MGAACNKHIMVMLSLSLLALVWSAAGYAAQNANFGLVQESREVDQQFKSDAEFPADYQWFYTGSPGSPRALMGISSAYRLDSDLWKPLDTSETSVSRMVTLINNNNCQYKFINFGSRIDGPQGELIGVWYSPIRRTTVAVQEDGTLKIAIPKKKAKSKHNL